LEKLLSVVIPAKNSSVYLADSLKSVLKQTYTNLEVIVVDDNSQDATPEIVKEFIIKDKRVKYVRNNDNKGSYYSRLIGYKIATGEYISFFDSDDILGCDYYHMLMNKIISENADMVISPFTVHYQEEDNYADRIYGNQIISNLNLKGNEIKEFFFKTQGKVPQLFLVWNKIYKKSLFDSCFHRLWGLNRNINMLDDFITNFFIFSKATHLVSSDCDSYYYSKHRNAMTSSENVNFETFESHIQDLIFAYDTTRKLFPEINKTEKNFEEVFKIFGVWKKFYSDSLEVKPYSPDEKKQLEKLLSTIKVDNPGADSLFYSERIFNDVSDFKKIKSDIADSKVKVVSFDVFDTLVTRPFLEPTELFEVVWHSLPENFKDNSLNFRDLRIKAEKQARVNIQNNDIQDITLDDIYKTLVSDFNFPTELAELCKQKEIETELKLCVPKENLKEIFEFSQYCNKKVICTSDMYLSSEIIRKILQNCGYGGDFEVFVSSETKSTKNSGDIFPYLFKKLDLNPYELIHIGDNYHSDYSIPLSLKIKKAYYFPNSKTVFYGDNINGIKNQTKLALKTEWLGKKTDANFSILSSSLGFRVAIALCSNILCSNKLSSNQLSNNDFFADYTGTDFKHSPYLMGYIAFGLKSYLNDKYNTTPKKNAIFDFFKAERSFPLFENRFIFESINSGIIDFANDCEKIKEKIDFDIFSDITPLESNLLFDVFYKIPAQKDSELIDVFGISWESVYSSEAKEFKEFSENIVVKKNKLKILKYHIRQKLVAHPLLLKKLRKIKKFLKG
jgi:glycosyltransferase involved in cell wall biosynthesis/FMN phosphatase YigB (HAD superfamily)